jgi:ribonuclease E
MDEHRNRSKVEKRIKEALKIDRARIQIGRISGFGLLEMSRQRLRPSLHEISTQTCLHCDGKGIVRSIESTALRVLRAIEKESIRSHKGQISVRVPPEVDLFILNQKRDVLSAIEGRHDLRIMVCHDASLVPPNFRIEGGAGSKTANAETSRGQITDKSSSPQRHGRRYIKDTEKTVKTASTVATGVQDVQDASPATVESGDGDQEGKPINKRRRRGKRGGRRHSRKSSGRETTVESATESAAESTNMDSRSKAPSATTEAATTKEDNKPTAKRRKGPVRRTRKPAKSAAAEKTAVAAGTARKEKAEENATATMTPATEIPPAATGKPKRRGWWNSLVE